MRSRTVALRSLLAGGLLASLGACVAEGPAPPRVDVPEPGGSAAARTRPASTARPSGSVPSSGTAARVTPAPSSSLPIPSAGPSAATPTGSFGSTYPSAGMPTGAGASAGGEGAPAADDSSAILLPGAAPAANDLVDPAHVPARSGNSAVNTLLAQADTARRAGNLDGALASAERALRIAPADPAVYYELAVLRLRRGEHAAAEQLARKGLSHQPDYELRQRLEDLLARLRSG